MYIKREPLGRGRLTFRKRGRRRYSLAFIAVYLGVLAAMLYVFLHMDTIQPRLLSQLGPAPTPTPSAAQLTALGYDAYMKGNLEEAIEYYRQAANLTPDDVQVLADLARLLILTDDPDNLREALEVADQAILIAPEDPRGYAVKARALDWMGNPDQAAIEALRAVELDPNYVLGQTYLAEAYADLGRLREARDRAELAIQLDPYNVDARRNYAYVLEHYGDYNGAIQQYQQALRLHPNLLDLWYGLARNYRGAKQIDQSIATYEQIIIRTPDDPLPWTELGRTYFEIRDDEAAQFNLERAMKLVCADCPRMTYNEIKQAGYRYDPSLLPDRIYVPAWRRLGNVYHARKNFEDAIAIYEELIAWGKAHPDEVPLEAYLEAYYVTAADYYYLDLCDIAIPRAFDALDIYETARMDNPVALNNILSVIVLCRDYALTPPTVQFEFPSRYPEPDVFIERPGSEGGRTGTGENP